VALAFVCLLVTACSGASPTRAEPVGMTALVSEADARAIDLPRGRLARPSAEPPSVEGTDVAAAARPPETVVVESVAPTPEPAAPAVAPVVSAPPKPAVAVPAPPPPAPQLRTTGPVVADDPTGLAQQLIATERAVRDPSVTGEQLAYLGHLQQLIYRRLLDQPAWSDAVFAALPADVRTAADLNIAATADLRPRSTVRVTALPYWTIVQPPPISELVGYYKEAESQFGVPWYYLASIHLVETRMGRIHGNSYAGAQGPMQFMPATWAIYGRGDINDPHDAILAAARYLRAAGAPGNMQRAIYAYNHDNSYVDAVIKYAEVMRLDPNAYRGFYGWQVYFITATDEVLLPVGYSKQ
jgi:soluble lytic murein transglycosylase-like protein